MLTHADVYRCSIRRSSRRRHTRRRIVYKSSRRRWPASASGLSLPLLYYCFTAASLLLYSQVSQVSRYHSFTTALLLLHYCFTAASLLLYCCFYYCFTAESVSFYCCFYHCFTDDDGRGCFSDPYSEVLGQGLGADLISRQKELDRQQARMLVLYAYADVC